VNPTRKSQQVKMAFRWHLRQVMASRQMFATSDLVPLLASRGVVLSREQVYRLVARTPQRLNLATLAALCDIFDVDPGELIEPVHAEAVTTPKDKVPAGVVTDLVPRRARIVPDSPR